MLQTRHKEENGHMNYKHIMDDGLLLTLYMYIYIHTYDVQFICPSLANQPQAQASHWHPKGWHLILVHNQPAARVLIKQPPYLTGHINSFFCDTDCQRALFTRFVRLKPEGDSKIRHCHNVAILQTLY